MFQDYLRGLISFPAFLCPSPPPTHTLHFFLQPHQEGPLAFLLPHVHKFPLFTLYEVVKCRSGGGGEEGRSLSFIFLSLGCLGVTKVAHALLFNDSCSCNRPTCPPCVMSEDLGRVALRMTPCCGH